MTTALVIGLLATPASGAASNPQPAGYAASDSFSGAVSERVANSGEIASVNTRLAPRSETCPAARKAIKFYSRRFAFWRGKMGAPRTSVASHGSRCPRYLAHRLQRKTYAARVAYRRWWEYHWHWQAWLPDKFARVGACETGYGRRPGSWTWDSGTYVSAFGIYWPAYAQFARALGLPTWDDPGARTPREQYLVASAIQQRFGWGAWGCGGA